MRVAVALLLLVTTLTAQDPPTAQKLEQALRELQKEVKGTRQELEHLRQIRERRDRIARERLAREQQRRAARKNWPRRERLELERRAAQDRAKSAARIRDLIFEMRTREKELTRSEMILAQLSKRETRAAPAATPNKAFIEVVTERNALREKIRRQNNRRLCRWFHLGCIGRK